MSLLYITIYNTISYIYYIKRTWLVEVPVVVLAHSARGQLLAERVLLIRNKLSLYIWGCIYIGVWV